MTLNGIMSAATSGLQVAQTGLRTVSDNIANVDTPGYIRKVADQTSVSYGGAGAGVTIAQIRLASDRFLQQASLDGHLQSTAVRVRETPARPASKYRSQLQNVRVARR